MPDFLTPAADTPLPTFEGDLATLRATPPNGSGSSSRGRSRPACRRCSASPRCARHDASTPSPRRSRSSGIGCSRAPGRSCARCSRPMSCTARAPSPTAAPRRSSPTCTRPWPCAARPCGSRVRTTPSSTSPVAGSCSPRASSAGPTCSRCSTSRCSRRTPYRARGLALLWDAPHAAAPGALSQRCSAGRAPRRSSPSTCRPRTTRLAERLAISAPTAAYHLAALRDAGLARASRAGREVVYARTARATPSSARRPPSREQPDVDDAAAAVDRQRGAVHVGGVVGEQPRDGRGGLLDARRPALRHEPVRVGVGLLAIGPAARRQVVHRGVAHRGAHPGRTDGVRAQPLRAEVERDRLDEHDHAGLRRAVRRRVGPGQDPGLRRHRDDRPFRSSRCGIAARATRKAPTRFARSTASKLSGVCSSTDPEREMPAFRTRASRPPRAATVSATMRSASAGAAVADAPRGRRSRRRRRGSGASRRPLTATRWPPRSQAAGDRGADAGAAAGDEGDAGHGADRRRSA